MSEQTIYQALRDGGLSPTGACAVMGNMFCESSLRSNIVELRSPLGGADYTFNVDCGTIPAQTFINDRYGYGLCQWTYPSRKEELLQTALKKAVSISDETMQCEFCVTELKRDYPSLYQFLCKTDDLSRATERVCSEFERPAVNNYSDRINAAQRYYNQIVEDDTTGDSPAPASSPGTTCQIGIRVLQKGCVGRDVFMAQCGLLDMKFECGKPDGDFGFKTEAAVKRLQKTCNLPVSGIINTLTWEVLLKEK